MKNTYLVEVSTELENDFEYTFTRAVEAETVAEAHERAYNDEVEAVGSDGEDYRPVGTSHVVQVPDEAVPFIREYFGLTN